jgi:hypothetical protein
MIDSTQTDKKKQLFWDAVTGNGVSAGKNSEVAEEHPAAAEGF